ncbi:MAG: lipopolysaccharide kinase InaA family protein [Zavarzinella sp.]
MKHRYNAHLPVLVREIVFGEGLFDFWSSQGRLLTKMADRWQWHRSPQYSDNFQIDLEQWLQLPATQVVKANESRTVYRVVLPEMVVYVKVCRHNGARSWLRDLARGPKAKLEFETSLAMNHFGIPVPTVVAWGRSYGFLPGTSILITQEVPEVRTFEEFLLSQTWTAQQQHHFARQFGQFVGQLHHQHVLHPDPHPGNLLVRADADGNLQFFLVDLHNLQFGRELSPTEIETNLLHLNRWFLQKTTFSVRRQFWLAYQKIAAVDTISPQVIEQRTWVSIQDLWDSRAKRCFRTNRSFHVVKQPPLQGYVDVELDSASLATLLENPEAPFKNESKLMKNSRTSTVGEVSIRYQGQTHLAIWKRFNIKKWWTPWTNRLVRSNALRSWLYAHHLLARGLPTAQPLLVLHRTAWFGKWEGYLLTLKIPDAQELPQALVPLTNREFANVLDQLAQHIGLFHATGLSHGDLKGPNILLSHQQGALRLYLIDLVAVRRVHRLPFRTRCQELARLNVSLMSLNRLRNSDRLRILRIYLNRTREQSHWKRAWTLIQQETKRKIDQNTARGRSIH